MVREGSMDPRGGLGRAGLHSERSGTVQGTLENVLDGSGDSWGGLGRVG